MSSESHAEAAHRPGTALNKDVLPGHRSSRVHRAMRRERRNPEAGARFEAYVVR